jgi:hypothetical protein
LVHKAHQVRLVRSVQSGQLVHLVRKVYKASQVPPVRQALTVRRVQRARQVQSGHKVCKASLVRRVQRVLPARQVQSGHKVCKAWLAPTVRQGPRVRKVRKVRRDQLALSQRQLHCALSSVRGHSRCLQAAALCLKRLLRQQFNYALLVAACSMTGAW